MLPVHIIKFTQTSFILFFSFFFFFNDTATTEIYTLSLHDALPISRDKWTTFLRAGERGSSRARRGCSARARDDPRSRSEEHTSELQSQSNLVCRLLLEKKKKHEQFICLSG